jgi:hypothetical protein
LTRGDAKLSKLLPTENGEPSPPPLIPEARLAKGEALLALPKVNLGIADGGSCDPGALNTEVCGKVDAVAGGAKMLLWDVPKLANGEDPVASLPKPEAEKALEDVCGKALAGEGWEPAASSVASGRSVVDEEFCVVLR